MYKVVTHRRQTGIGQEIEKKIGQRGGRDVVVSSNICLFCWYNEHTRKALILRARYVGKTCFWHVENPDAIRESNPIHYRKNHFPTPSAEVDKGFIRFRTKVVGFSSRTFFNFYEKGSD